MSRKRKTQTRATESLTLYAQGLGLLLGALSAEVQRADQDWRETQKCWGSITQEMDALIAQPDTAAQRLAQWRAQIGVAAESDSLSRHLIAVRDGIQLIADAVKMDLGSDGNIWQSLGTALYKRCAQADVCAEDVADHTAQEDPAAARTRSGGSLTAV